MIIIMMIIMMTMIDDDDYDAYDNVMAIANDDW